MSLSKRIQLITGIAIAAIFFLALLFTSISARRQTIEQTHIHLSEKASNYMNRLENDLIKPIQMLHSIDALFEDSFFPDYNQSLAIFQNFSKALPESSGFIGAMSDGTYYDGVDWIPPEGWIATQRPWYTAAASNPGKIVFTEVYIDSQLNVPVVSIAKGLQNRQGNCYAVIAVDFPLSSITELISEINMGKNENSFIIDKQGTFIAHETYGPEDNISMVENGSWQKLENLTSGLSQFVRIKVTQKPYHFVAIPFTVIDWFFVLGETESSVYAFSNSILRLFIVSFLIIFVFLIILLGTTISTSLRPLSEVTNLLGDIAQGDADLSKRIQVKAHGEVKELAGGFNKFGEKLEKIVQGIKKSNNLLKNDSNQMQVHIEDEAKSIQNIVSTIGSVSNQINEQSNAVIGTVETMKEITSNIGELDEMIESQSQSVQSASSTVEQMIVTIKNINDSVDKLASSFERIASQSKEGQEKQSLVNTHIIQIESQSEMLQEANAAISAVAEQTNLLAMNAAIESAHAGDAGKGFAVVADEIRKLSETSTEQSKTIGDQLTNIKNAITVMVKSVMESNESFESLSKEISDTDMLVNEIKDALKEQNTSGRQITASLSTMRGNTNNVKQTSAKMTEDSKLIFEEISALQKTTQNMLDAVQNMSKEAQDVNDARISLLKSSKKMQEQVEQIGSEIDLFK